MNTLLSPSGSTNSTTIHRDFWLFSWPLLVCVAVYLGSLLAGARLLNDGDTYLHIASGQWILAHGAAPVTDPFSHTMPGAVWTAHEWLSAVVLAIIYNISGWTGVVALTALMFAITLALLARTLLKFLEPIYALLFVVLGASMTMEHLLARPHILATPLMMIWTIGLVRAREGGRAPSWWLLPVMTLWANMHGGFTLGLALIGVFALEAVLAARQEQRAFSVAKSWAVFLLLAVLCSLLTPNGVQGILYTWQVLAQLSYALETIGEWQSPNFRQVTPMEVWLLAGMAMFMFQGLKLPPIRLLLLLGLLHLALKHGRYVELLGLLVPVFIAEPLAAQWKQKSQQPGQAQAIDRFFHKLARPAGAGAITLAAGCLLALMLLASRAQPVQPNQLIAPTLAISAVQAAGIRGPVLNEYTWGGYLIFSGIAPFIDGRADMYGDAFLKAYAEALALKEADGLETLMRKYKIEWTLLPPDTPAVTLLDHLPGWRRLYADKVAVVHVKVGAE